MIDRALVVDAVCESLTKEVALIAPHGLGRWDRTWEIVDPSSADFLECLARWEMTGEQADQDRCDLAYAAVINAWEHAAAEYKAVSR